MALFFVLDEQRFMMCVWETLWDRCDALRRPIAIHVRWTPTTVDSKSAFIGRRMKSLYFKAILEKSQQQTSPQPCRKKTPKRASASISNTNRSDLCKYYRAIFYLKNMSSSRSNLFANYPSQHFMTIICFLNVGPVFLSVDIIINMLFARIKQEEICYSKLFAYPQAHTYVRSLSLPNYVILSSASIECRAKVNSRWRS